MGIKKSGSTGYTLIEMLIVIAIIGIILPTVFSIVYVIVNQQFKVFRIIETKRQGDYTLTFIKEKILREAISVQDAAGNPHCLEPGIEHSSAGGNDFVFVTTSGTYQFTSVSSGNVTYLQFIENSNSPVALTTNKVTISDFNISCEKRNSITKPIIDINFNVSFSDASPTVQEGIVSLPYKTKLKLRN